MSTGADVVKSMACYAFAKPYRWRGVLARAGTIALLTFASAPSPAADDLGALAERLAGRFDRIDHIAPATLAEWRQSGRDVILLDVRSSDEYAVGHLPGAIRIPPGARASVVMARIDGPITEAQIVAYCSVGQRSSALASAAQRALHRAGAAGVSNLRGGVFAWHNQGRPLVDAAGPTERVHPYSERWASYLERRDQVAFSPHE
jgi:rhodanese-related sulfurtransferase